MVIKKLYLAFIRDAPVQKKLAEKGCYNFSVSLLMKTKKFLPLIAIMSVLLGLLIVQPLLSAPANAQVFIYTPTPESNGNIYYIVKSGDTCTTITLTYNISLDQLRSLNQLELNDCDSLRVGRKLLLAVVPTPVITAGPSPTPTSSLPTPMPVIGKGTICIYLYDDVNGNAVANDGENSLAGGEISISSTAGDYTKTASTTGDGNAVCFEDINEGPYSISVAIPDGYNPTTAQNYTVTLKAGDTSTIDFGAQVGSHLDLGGEGTGGKSILLAIIGGLVLLAAGGIGLYVYMLMKRK
jgi:LysM repeat protein